jgi:membrane protein required for colicin V production
MNMADFNWVDFTILGILCFSTLISLVRGFVREAISLATWIVAIWVAYKYGHDFGQNMLTTVGNEQARYLIGAGILFFAVLILGALVNFVMSRFLFLTGLSAIDRIL